jgi:hypothetical protein
VPGKLGEWFTSMGCSSLDVLGHPLSLIPVWNKLLRSYAMEALEAEKAKHHDHKVGDRQPDWLHSD